MKNILGLDLGTNSIGWAFIDTEKHKICGAGSRIIPIDAEVLGAFEKGKTQSPMAARRQFRTTRRMIERVKLRRSRLHRALHILGFLPAHYEAHIDFNQHPGEFIDESEPLLPYRRLEDGSSEFIFKESFYEMLDDFRQHQPTLVAKGRKVPHDWTIYYLRKKALTERISGEELAWILLNFNAKRGYYQLRGMDDATDEVNNNKEFRILTVTAVTQGEPVKGKEGFFNYEIAYDNGAIQQRQAASAPKKVGDRIEAICTTKIMKDGSKQISVTEPKEDDWTLRKKKTESDITLSGKTVGAYIYDTLLRTPDVKVRGKLVHTIERRFYRDELERILLKQQNFIPELQDQDLLKQCATHLYGSNKAEHHAQALTSKGWIHLLLDDILFYQRPLKSQKGTIASCPLERRQYVDKETGEIKLSGIPCIPKSHPLFQEYRIWQFISNLRIYAREKMVNGKLCMNYDVTATYLPNHEAYARLYAALDDRKDINQDSLLGIVTGLKKKEVSGFRWNYPEDKTYPCNVTRQSLPKAYRQIFDESLWHILYSVTDPQEIVKALTHYAERINIEVTPFIEALRKVFFKERGYAAYSAKALKKLVPLMRRGAYWHLDDVDAATRVCMETYLAHPETDAVSSAWYKVGMDCHTANDFQGLSLSQASYLVYGRHAETDDTERWTSPEQLDYFVQHELRAGSLRNPVVEKMVCETLRVVSDVWKTYGHIDEIHVEMARELKQNSEGRERDSRRNAENERANHRARFLLQEFSKPTYKVKNVRPYSPSQLDLFKIFEQEILEHSGEELKNNKELNDIVKNLGNPAQSAKISFTQINRYRLWLEQKYVSPYTGQPIPLSDLFTTAYEIEHVIPQSRHYDNSMRNKVICECEVNKDKSNMTGYEYILKRGGSVIQGSSKQAFTILKPAEYEAFVKEHYRHNPAKMRNLLTDDIPESFTNRDLNHTQYMTRLVLSLLSKVVREEGEVTSVSKHILAPNGSITTQLKNDWGLNEVWNRLVAPRFVRMNDLSHSQLWGEERSLDGKRFFQISQPLHLPTINKKRIDHRHHAMDALVIACTSRNHINYLNFVSAHAGENHEKYELRQLLMDTKSKTYKKPWPTFTQDCAHTLEQMVVSFKKNLRIMSRLKNGSLGVRKPLHKETFSGKVRLQRIKSVSLKEALKDWHHIQNRSLRHEIKRLVNEEYHRFDATLIERYFKDRNYIFQDENIRKVNLYYLTDGKEACSANRSLLDISFTEKKIAAVTDSGIRTILLRHLHQDIYRDATGNFSPELAFSPEGIAAMNANLQVLNGGKKHQPIYKVRVAESLGMKFTIGAQGVKAKQYVEAAKGTNLFFAVYGSPQGKRCYATIPLREVIARTKQHLAPAPELLDDGSRLLFTLSPGDLVYLPEAEEKEIKLPLNHKRIYKMVSSNKLQCFFIPHTLAKVLEDREEYGSQNKIEKSDDGLSIKEYGLKLEVDRLGRITAITPKNHDD